MPSMRILVTAGNTLTPIDRVRGITNIFTGRTGAAIAARACQRGDAVTLLTSHPEALDRPTDERLTIEHYRTFDELAERLERGVRAGEYDALIHCAAVSDYRCSGVYAPAGGAVF